MLPEGQRRPPVRKSATSTHDSRHAAAAAADAATRTHQQLLPLCRSRFRFCFRLPTARVATLSRLVARAIAPSRLPNSTADTHQIAISATFAIQLRAHPLLLADRPELAVACRVRLRDLPSLHQVADDLLVGSIGLFGVCASLFVEPDSSRVGRNNNEGIRAGDCNSVV